MIFFQEEGQITSILPYIQDATSTIPSDFGWQHLQIGLESKLPKQVMGMNYRQRYYIFCMLLLLSIFFIIITFFIGLPTLTLRPQKFAICFTFASLLSISSFIVLNGFSYKLFNVFHMDQFPFTATYCASTYATLYYTFRVNGVKGYIFVLLSSLVQLIIVIQYLISFLPGGLRGLQVLVGVLKETVIRLLIQCLRLWTSFLFNWVIVTSPKLPPSNKGSLNVQLRVRVIKKIFKDGALS